LCHTGSAASVLKKQIAAEVAKRMSQSWLPVFLRKKVTVVGGICDVFWCN